MTGLSLCLSAALVQVGSEEEDVHCSRLMFKEDFLSDQYFGENRPASIITEKVHFGEGMHRRAFRTKLQAGQIALLVPGHSCVLKVHNSISYGTKNNDELVQKNFSLAVEVRTSENSAVSLNGPTFEKHYVSQSFNEASPTTKDQVAYKCIIHYYQVHRFLNTSVL